MTTPGGIGDVLGGKPPRATSATTWEASHDRPGSGGDLGGRP